MDFLPPKIPLFEIETISVLKKLTLARAALAELKGVASTIPNEQILIDTLSLQEAKDSSEIENIITTHDEVYRSITENRNFATNSAKEVYRYSDALKVGFDQVRKNGFIHLNLILNIQEIIEENRAGVRKVPGTVLKNESTDQVIYTPPQHHDEIIDLIKNLENFMNDQITYDTDPLIKMAIIHHQFESIHPFYDGNGRTGRIINILYLIKEELLNLPILYISKYITNNKEQYYELLQSTRENATWEQWILYMLDAVEKTAIHTVGVIKGIRQLMQKQKQKIRDEQPKMYSQDLINNLFRHPYTKIKLIENDLGVSRLTARKYLEVLTEMKILFKVKKGKSNYYINSELFSLLGG
ncbi:MAG: Fic family protein [Cyclobacteriaceae bacterium]